MHHAKRILYQRWARRLIAFYPTRWRERYSDEMLLILEDSPPTAGTILNLFIHLFDAYLHQALVKERTLSMLQRMRTNELVIYGATLIFFVAWFLAQLHVTVPGQPEALSSSFSYTPSLLVNIIHSVSYILPLLLLLGGLPILLAACWQALKARNFRALLFCLLGLISPLVIPILAFVGAAGVTSIWPFLFCAFSGLGISLALIIFSVQRVTPSRRITHYALSLAVSIPLIMLVGLVALLFGLSPSLVTPFATGDSIVYVIREDLLILIMIVTLSLSLISLKKGIQAKQAA